MADKNEAEGASHIVDRTGDWTFMSELIKRFGVASAARILGWAVLIGATLKDGEPANKAVDKLTSFGLSRSGVYRVLAEIQVFKMHLEEVEQRKIKIEDVLDGLRKEAAS